ncbi:MAG TPA: hypothetical protein VIM16_12700 [Mucilaginibacter sp.]|jgi:hypothetical protein
MENQKVSPTGGDLEGAGNYAGHASVWIVNIRINSFLHIVITWKK